MTELERHPLYLEGIACFNRGCYFESHEVWEDIWNETTGLDRDFLKGLIQAAVCLHHLGNRNWEGSAKLLASSRGYLLRYEPVFWGLDVGTFLEAMAASFAAIREADGRFAQACPSAWGPQIRLKNSAF